MSVDQTAQQWRVMVGGGEQTVVHPGESIEIGRKPLRPLPDTGIRRFEVSDQTRSMSKRHAVCSVSDMGVATVRDLDSTNGSYMVGSTGELMRLPVAVDFPLPGSPTRLQFGDVPVDFMRVEVFEPEPQRPVVPDLFAYAIPDAHQEPDAADMSVDQILDLRAGEPTTMFQAQSPAGAQPRDLFANVAGIAPIVEASAAPMSAEEPADIEVEPVSEPEPVTPQPEPVEAAEPTASENADMAVAPQETEAAPVSEAGSESGSELGSEPVAEVSVAEPEVAQPDDMFRPMAAEPVAEPVVQPIDMPADGMVGGQDASQADAAQTFTPAFEPGSVFEKVSNGQFAAVQQTIEVDGMTSEDAKRTTDFTMQFEMARHEALQPFLAMNPALYDDLFAWLAAQGNKDIDEALARNEGYRDYLAAIGK